MQAKYGNLCSFFCREEDQLLLLTCKEHGVSGNTWQKISQSLPHRREQEISSRYYVLMEKLRSWVQATTPEYNAETSSDESNYDETSDTDSDEEN